MPSHFWVRWFGPMLHCATFVPQINRHDATNFYQLLPASTSFYQLLPASTSFYQLLPAATSFYQLLPASTSFYQLLPASTSFYQLLPASTSFYQLLPSDVVWMNEFGPLQLCSKIKNDSFYHQRHDPHHKRSLTQIGNSRGPPRIFLYQEKKKKKTGNDVDQGARAREKAPRKKPRTRRLF